MEFDNQFLSWNVTGETREIANTKKQQIIMKCILKSQFSMSPKEVAEKTDLDPGYVRVTLKRLCEQGLISKTEYGQYENLSI